MGSLREDSIPLDGEGMLIGLAGGQAINLL